MADLSALHQIALTLHRQGQFTDAEQCYRQILQLDATDWDTWNNLGALYYAMQQYEAALAAVQTALSSDRPRAMYYCTLGLVLEQLGEVPAAIAAYQNGIALEPQVLDLYTNLTALLCDRGEWAEAETICRQAIAVDDNHLDSYYNLGTVLMAQQRRESAIQVYRQALLLNPLEPRLLLALGTALSPIDHPRALLCFGDAYYAQHRYSEAVHYYQTLIDDPLSDWDAATIAQVYARLGDCCRWLQQPDAAVSVYQQGVERCPDRSGLYLELIWTLRSSGQIQAAVEVAEQAATRFPNDLYLQRENHLLLPILYDTPAEIDQFRDRFSRGLITLIQSTPLDTLQARQDALYGISAATNFYLQYQGRDDCELQRQYGDWVHRIMAANYPQWVQPLAMPVVDDRIRIGYLSNFFCDHTISKLFMGWFQHADRNQFRIHGYHLGQSVDQWTQELYQSSDAFYHIPFKVHLDAYVRTIAEQVLADQLHVLVYPDLGMSPITTMLAGLRLAPVQAVSWGHPVTSGLPTVDYMLSSQLMEPAEAQAHYTEKLVTLPGLGIVATPFAIPPCTMTREALQLRPESVVYLSCQSLYKYLPQHDWVFAAIAQRVPNAQFVFIANENLGLSQQFAQRLQRSFATAGLNVEDYCVVLPRQSQADYWQVNQLADVYLDTLDWSGGTTTLEAIACNLPVVTCPGALMRGRHGYGILHHLGVTETIATDTADYVAIASRLGTDPVWRSTIQEQLMQVQGKLYTDLSAIAALEQFYHQVVLAC